MKQFFLILVIIGALEIESYDYEPEPEYPEKSDRPDFESYYIDEYLSEYLREEKELEELAASYYF